MAIDGRESGLLENGPGSITFPTFSASESLMCLGAQEPWDWKRGSKAWPEAHEIPAELLNLNTEKTSQQRIIGTNLLI
jgi:hypothetical protein